MDSLFPPPEILTLFQEAMIPEAMIVCVFAINFIPLFRG